MRLLAILLTLIFYFNALAVAPYGFKGQDQTPVQYSNVLQFPKNQVTPIGGINSLVESGNMNLLSNPGFEHTTVTTSWTNAAGTPTAETTTVYNGKKALKVALSAQTLTLTNDSTSNASNLANVQGVAKIWVNTTVSGASVCSRQAGVTSSANCVTVSADGKWHQYIVPFVMGTTSNGISVATSGNVTGDFYFDEAYVGQLDVYPEVAQARIAGQSYWASTANCLPTRTSTTLGAMTDVDCPGPTISYFSTGSWQTTDADTIKQTVNSLPAGVYEATFVFNAYPGSAGADAQFAITDGTTTCVESGVHPTNTGGDAITLSCVFEYTSSGNRNYEIYARSTSGQAIIDNSTATGKARASQFILKYFPPPTKIYSQNCETDSSCENIFVAQIDGTTSPPTISGENVSGWLTGACTRPSTGRFKCDVTSGVFSEVPSCKASCFIDEAGSTPNCSANMGDDSTATNLSFTAMNGASTALNTKINIICSKKGADYVQKTQITGTFKDVELSPNTGGLKKCYYAWGGAAATLSAPTECTGGGSCTEVIDTCAAGTPPTNAATGQYHDMVFASGTWKASSYITCACTAWDTTTALPRECTNKFMTGGNTWATDANGGYDIGFHVYGTTGTTADAYVSLECTSEAP